MQRFQRMRSLQKFVAVHASVFNHFNSARSFYPRANFKQNRSAALAEWRIVPHGVVSQTFLFPGCSGYVSVVN